MAGGVCLSGDLGGCHLCVCGVLCGYLAPCLVVFVLINFLITSVLDAYMEVRRAEVPEDGGGGDGNHDFFRQTLNSGMVWGL
eukprot:7794068-Pyramimonas_sp.AAC.1